MKLTEEEHRFFISCVANGFDFKRETEMINNRNPDIEVNGKPMTYERFCKIADYISQLITEDQKNYI